MKTYLRYISLTALSLFLSFSIMAQHFEEIWVTLETGNPQFGMQIMVFGASIDGAGLEVDDEIAVFDVNGDGDEICVGVHVLTSSTPPFAFAAGADESVGSDPQNGFVAGHTIIYRFWDSSESQEITLTDPTYNATSDLVYTVSGTAQLDDLTGYSINYWTGGEDDDWNKTDNWNTGLIPNAGADVQIDIEIETFPDLTSSSGECNNITLTASINGYGSILGNGNLTVNGTANVETWISSDKWHMVSSPVADQTAGVYYLGGDPKVYITRFNETTNSYVYITNLSYPLEDMTGYMVWVNDPEGRADVTFTYSGVMNDGTFTRDDLTRTVAGENGGWNMVGNPYPSTIDWDAASGWTKTNVDNAIYIINNGGWASYVTGSGGTNGGSQYIAPGQGFFVRVTEGQTVGTLTMNDDVRLHEYVEFLKSAKEVNNYVKLVAAGNERTDEIVIRFTDDATTTFDSQFDAYKKFTTYDEIPQIYTNTDVEYAINSLPSVDELPMGFKAGIDGEYSISISEIDQIGEVWLEDLLTGETTNLTENTYTFDHLSGADPARFVVHFSTVSVEDTPENNIRVYAYNNKIYVNSTSQLEGEIAVVNLLGQEVARSAINGLKSELTIHNRGYYVVKVTTGNSITTRKVFIK